MTGNPSILGGLHLELNYKSDNTSLETSGCVNIDGAKYCPTEDASEEIVRL